MRTSAKRLAWLRAYRSDERIKAQRKAYYEANRERILAYQKAYRESDKEIFAEWEKAYQCAYYEAKKAKKQESSEVTWT